MIHDRSVECGLQASPSSMSENVPDRHATHLFGTAQPWPAMQVTRHTMSVAVLHCEATPFEHVFVAVQGEQGDAPVEDQEVPTMHAALHVVSDDAVHDVWIPRAHVESGAQVAQGDAPLVDHVLPATHAIVHSVSDVLVQTCATPLEQVESAAHAAHGDTPLADHVLPATHATAHTVSVSATHVLATPNAHVEDDVQDSQGVLPVADHVLPAAHGTDAAGDTVIFTSSVATFPLLSVSVKRSTYVPVESSDTAVCFALASANVGSLAPAGVEITVQR